MLATRSCLGQQCRAGVHKLWKAHENTLLKAANGHLRQLTLLALLDYRLMHSKLAKECHDLQAGAWHSFASLLCISLWVLQGKRHHS